MGVLNIEFVVVSCFVYICLAKLLIVDMLTVILHSEVTSLSPISIAVK